MFIHTNFPVSFSHESTTLLASPQFRSPVSFNLSQLAVSPISRMSLPLIFICAKYAPPQTQRTKSGAVEAIATACLSSTV
jgi:hypothetical protein